jgi:hypothetical protein
VQRAAALALLDASPDVDPANVQIVERDWAEIDRVMTEFYQRVEREARRELGLFMNIATAAGRVASAVLRPARRSGPPTAGDRTRPPSARVVHE